MSYALRDYFAASMPGDICAIRVKEDRETLAGRRQPDDYPHGMDSVKFNMEVEAAVRFMYADAMLRLSFSS